MAIAMNCPACQKAYRLKDELAGKKVACSNAACRKVFAVPAAPKPVAAAVDAEAMAAAAFGEEVADPTAADLRTIAMTCISCEHKWAVPWAMQGKNVLCPDCRQRQKVPEQKVVKPADWRSGRGGPSLAKQPTLDNVVSSGDAGFVSGQALRDAGLGGPVYEDRPLWQKVAVVAVPLALVAAVGLGFMMVSRSRTAGKQEQAMQLALDDLPDPAGTAVPAAEVHLARAAVVLAAAEYAARRPDKTPAELADAVKQFARVRQELDAAAPSTGRDFLFQELAATQPLLGGDAEQVLSGQRIRWVAQGAGTARAKINEKVYDVQGELRQTFAAMQSDTKPVSLDARIQTLLRAARDLAQGGVPNAAEQLVPVLFAATEQPDALAQAGVEAYRATGAVDRAEALVNGVLPTLAPGRPASPALVALGQLLPTPPAALPMPGLPGGAGPIDEATRTAHVTLAVLKKNSAEAVEVAKRPGRTDGRLRMLAFVAETADDPAPAIAAAADIANGDAQKKEGGTAPDGLWVRLAGLAGRANNAAAVDALAKACAKDDARALARAEGQRYLWAAAGRPVPESAAEMPADAKDVRLGHLWARLHLARANAAAGEVRPVTEFEAWGRGAGRPFGLAGQALGQQDRNRR